MFGAILEVSGGAQTIAVTMVKKFGDEKAAWALGHHRSRDRDAGILRCRTDHPDPAGILPCQEDEAFLSVIM